jgi:hypothetical protein
MHMWGGQMGGGPVKWTERWVARAQRKADLRDKRFRRHEEGVRAGTEEPGFLERLGPLIPVDPLFQRRYVNADFPPYAGRAGRGHPLVRR